MQETGFINLATTAPSADNSQPWFFSQNAGALICEYYNRSLGHDPFGPLGHGTLMATGALLENICLLTKSSSVTPTFSIESSSWKIKIENYEQLREPNSEIANLLLARHTNRHPFRPFPFDVVPTQSQSSLSRLFFIYSPEEVQTLARSLNECSVIRFNTRELHDWLFSSLRWTPKEVELGTGLDIKTLHLPPGGQQFMHWISPWSRMRLLNRFGISRILAAADSALFCKAPGVIAFIGSQDSDGIVDCGRLMQRTWLTLNQQGIAVHPYYVLTDISNRYRQNRLEERWNRSIKNSMAAAAEICQLQGSEQIHMLFRIGLPSVTPVRSKRLPVSSFFESR